MRSISGSPVLAIALLLVILPCEYFVVRAFFDRLEPAAIRRVEATLGVEIRYANIPHAWATARHTRDKSAVERIAHEAAVSVAQLGFLICLILAVLGTVAVPVLVLLLVTRPWA